MIEVKQLYKSFGKQRVLQGVDLAISAGSIFALLGANGTGKSTLTYILARIISPSAGHIFLEGEEINTDSFLYRSRFGYVFEKPLYLPRFSAREQLEYSACMYELPAKVYKPRIAELLDFFELPTGSKKFIETYSKGMKSKVSLAMALIHSPSYLVLDEPFDGIDFYSTQKICKLFKSMAAGGCTILVTSHQYEILSEIADRFALLKEGKIIFSLSKKELEEKVKVSGHMKDPVRYYFETHIKKEGSKDSLSFL